MRLKPIGNEFYTLEVASDPAVAVPWEASFDGGTTWLPSTTVGDDGWFRWLVAGPEADPAGATVLQLGRTVPLIRVAGNPEKSIVRDGPLIDCR